MIQESVGVVEPVVVAVASVEPIPKAPEKAKKKRGQPTKLTPDLLEKVKRGFTLGMTARRVCDLLRIGESTFFLWVSLGKEEAEAGKRNGHYLEFLETVRQAQAEFDDKHLEHIGSDPDWRARAWLLERVRPDQFAPKDTTRRSDEVDQPRQGVVVTAEVIDPLHELLDEAKRQGPGTLLALLEQLTGKVLTRQALPPHVSLDTHRQTEDIEVHGQ